MTKWRYVRQYYSVLVFIVRVRVSTSPGPQFIIRCLLLKLPSKTFRPSIKVFWKDHYLDCVLTLTQQLENTISIFCWSKAKNNTVAQNMERKNITSFTSTNVKLRLRFDVHLTFHWHSSDVLTIIWPSPDPFKTLPNLD